MSSHSADSAYSLTKTPTHLVQRNIHQIGFNTKGSNFMYLFFFFFYLSLLYCEPIRVLNSGAMDRRQEVTRVDVATWLAHGKRHLPALQRKPSEMPISRAAQPTEGQKKTFSNLALHVWTLKHFHLSFPFEAAVVETRWLQQVNL